MKKLIIFIILFIAAPLSGKSPLDFKSSINVNYPGLGIKWILNNNKAIEFKSQYTQDKDIQVFLFGGRLYKYFGYSTLLLYGFELDFTRFEMYKSNGNGLAIEPFIGAEHLFSKNMSLQFDIGPALIYLTQNNVSLQGYSTVVNFNINWYWK